MSPTTLDHSPDLQRLRKEGYNVSISNANFLLVHDVPYINEHGEVAIGILASDLDLAGDVTVQPKDHTVKFVGEYPCDASRKQLEAFRHGNGVCEVGKGLVAKYSFSRKPPRGHYTDYYEKMTAYVALLGKYVAEIAPYANARTGRVLEPEDDESPFNYLETASARADINTATAKLAEDAVAIIGLGGTGSYVLDMVAKTPVKQIHLFDADEFLTHNAFRAPGAPSIEELRERPLKVDYFKAIYSRMHRGIVEHPVTVDATNADQFRNMSFVFLCMASGPEKHAIISKLEEYGTAFADVGMGLYVKRGSVGGILQSVLSLPDAREQARNRISFATDNADNEYDKNIQIADLNALNACLAVMMWKKLRGFYFNFGKERFNTYTIGTSQLEKDDII